MYLFSPTHYAYCIKLYGYVFKIPEFSTYMKSTFGSQGSWYDNGDLSLLHLSSHVLKMALDIELTHVYLDMFKHDAYSLDTGQCILHHLMSYFDWFECRRSKNSNFVTLWS